VTFTREALRYARVMRSAICALEKSLRAGDKGIRHWRDCQRSLWATGDAVAGQSARPPGAGFNRVQQVLSPSAAEA